MPNQFLVTLILMKLSLYGEDIFFSAVSFLRFHLVLPSTDLIVINCYCFCFIIARYRPPDVLLGSKDYTTSLDMW